MGYCISDWIPKQFSRILPGLHEPSDNSRRSTAVLEMPGMGSHLEGMRIAVKRVTRSLQLLPKFDLSFDFNLIIREFRSLIQGVGYQLCPAHRHRI